MTKRGVNKTAIEKILKRGGYTLRRSAGVWVVSGHGKRREFDSLRAVAGMIQGRDEQERVAALMEKKALADMLPGNDPMALVRQALETNAAFDEAGVVGVNETPPPAPPRGAERGDVSEAEAREIIREAEAEWEDAAQDESEASGEVNDECD